MGYIPTGPGGYQPIQSAWHHLVQAGLPEAIAKPYWQANDQFQHNGPEYVEIWRRCFVELCVEDGALDRDWLSRDISKISDKPVPPRRV